MRDFAKRARACGIVGNRWPYGATGEAQERLVIWAESRMLKIASPGHRCLKWVRTGACRSQVCFLRGGPWDHVTGWTFEGKPALLLAQPYGISSSDLGVLAELVSDDALRVQVVSGNWYGRGTVGIEVWNKVVGDLNWKARTA